jgi:IclR family transcriptional regulator, acetate operon repressor
MPLLQAELNSCSGHTVDPAQLKKELDLVLERGHACAMEEYEIGLDSVGAPIRTLDGRVIAAVTASGPTFRITDVTLLDIAKHVLAAAGEVSQRHGYPRRG